MHNANHLYKSLYDLNNDAILTLNENGTIIDVNKSAHTLFGTEISSKLGTKFYQLIDPKSYELLEKMIQLLKQGEICEEVIHLTKNSKKEISFLAKFIPIDSDDLSRGMYFILKEISWFDELSKQVSESEKNFQIIAENIQDVIILMNEKKEFIYISPASKKVFHYDPASYTKDNPPFFNIHPDDVKHLEEQFEKSIKTKQPFKMVVKGLHLDKGWIWTEMSGTPVFDKDSKFSRMVLVARDISSQKEKEERLHFLAYHDYLTELPNRRFFYEKLDEAIERLNRQNHPFVLIMLDLDDFKLINDQLGHENGDKVIIEFGKRIVEAMGEEGIVARLGGDEFIILLNHYSSEQKLLHLIYQIQNRITEEYILDPQHCIHISSSIGVVICNKKNMDPAYYIKNVDEALYNVKYMGKNKFFIKMI